MKLQVWGKKKCSVCLIITDLHNWSKCFENHSCRKQVRASRCLWLFAWWLQSAAGKRLSAAEQGNWAFLWKAASHGSLPRRLHWVTLSIGPLPLYSPAVVMAAAWEGAVWLKLGGREQIRTQSNEMSRWSQGKWEADLRTEECRWGRRGGDMWTWQRNGEGKPGGEGVERLRLDEGQRGSLILGLGSSRVWEEHKGPESGSWHWSGKGSGNTAGGKSEGRCTGMEQRQKTLHPPKCALASSAGMGPKRNGCRPHHCLQIPFRHILWDKTQEHAFSFFGELFENLAGMVVNNFAS